MYVTINVWYYNDLLKTWIIKGTCDYQGTKDEYKYFRVISEGKKYFYSSVNDYYEHNRDHVKIPKEFTDVNGKILM